MVMESSQKLILAFVTLILGAVLVVVIATNSLAVTDKVIIADEAIDIGSSVVGGQVNESVSNFTVTNNPTGWKIIDCPLITVTYGNATDDYVLNTDYESFPAAGIIHVLNTTTTENGGNDTLIDYTYCADDYLNLSWGRTLLNLVAGFFAISLLMISVALFFSIAKDYGLV